MSIRIQSVPGEYYHIYNRGVDKRLIFNGQHDYQRFLLLLLLANDTKSVDVRDSIMNFSIPEIIQLPRTPLVSIFAFSLMANHFHLLTSPVVEHGVGKFMQKLATGYTLYFNNVNDRTGSLFQGKYKVKHVEDDRYLKYLFEYIHLNPIREEFDKIGTGKVKSLIEKVEIDPWTSLSVYSGRETGRLSESVLDKTLFGQLFSSYKKHHQSLCDWKADYFNEGPTFVSFGIK